MKATFVNDPGKPDALIYGDFPEPQIGAEDLLVRVKATSLNHRDVFAREGSHGVKPPLPYVPGLEVAGEVVAVGERVKDFTIGAAVLGRSRGGGGCLSQARVDVLRRGGVHVVPFSSAWHMLICRAALQPGEDLLVMAAGSGKLAGARVIATVSTDEKLAKAKALGADDGINYRVTPEFSKKVHELTGGAGVHVLFEHIGAPVWQECYG